MSNHANKCGQKQGVRRRREGVRRRREGDQEGACRRRETQYAPRMQTEATPEKPGANAFQKGRAVALKP